VIKKNFTQKIAKILKNSMSHYLLRRIWKENVNTKSKVKKKKKICKAIEQKRFSWDITAVQNFKQIRVGDVGPSG